MCTIHSKSGQVKKLKSNGREENGSGHKVKWHEWSCNRVTGIKT